MALTNLGKYITECQLTNEKDAYGEDAVVGISTQKQIIQTKADLDGVKLSSYKLLRPKHFAYVPDTSRRGDKMSLCFNDSDNTYLVSSISVVFFVSDEEDLCAEYLFMYFNRPEFDRYSRFHSWGSARESFTWDDMCDIELELPPLSVQQKYVNIYKAMVENQKTYECGLEDLKLVCDGYIEDLRRRMPCEKIGKYIKESNEKNEDYAISDVKGVTSSSTFETTKANIKGVDIGNYKVVGKKFFAYNPSRINIGSIALRDGDRCIVSPMYVVFRCEEHLLPEYLMLWFLRTEFQRSTLFFASGSVRDSFDYDSMCDVEIPIPDIKVQQAIADIYNVYVKRREINERLKKEIKEICPVLVKGALEEGARSDG